VQCPRCHDRLTSTLVGRPPEQDQGPYRSLVSLAPDGELIVELDACGRCGGTWFDAGETLALARIKKLPGDWADEFYVLDVEAYLRLPCPRCEEKMTKVRSLTNRRIYYDVCVQCRGMWFDVKEVKLLMAELEKLTAKS